MEFLDATWFPLPRLLGEGTLQSTLTRRHVHFVGSLPVSGPEDSFRFAVSRFPAQVKRIPDGHPGVRRNTSQWQVSLLRAASLGHLTGLDQGPHQVSLADSSGSLLTLNAEFDQHASSSYNIFAGLKAAGVIPPDVRFQVSVPNPRDITSCSILPAHQHLIEGYYEEALRRSLNRIQARIPHKELAIQIDCHLDPVNVAIPSIIRLLNAIAAEIQVGLHIHPSCNSDTGIDTSECVNLAESLVRQAHRPISYFHFPFPEVRTTVSLAAMRDLSMDWGCEVSLGLVHGDHDSIRRRMESAAVILGDNFGISTPCGLGNLDDEEFQNVIQGLEDGLYL